MQWNVLPSLIELIEQSVLPTCDDTHTLSLRALRFASRAEAVHRIDQPQRFPGHAQVGFGEAITED
jgi:hypothetical protein